MRVHEDSIGVVVEVGPGYRDTLTSLRRSFTKYVNVYVFPSFEDIDSIRDLRTVCNSLHTEDFNIRLFEMEFDRNEYFDSSIPEEKYTILISKDVFFLTDNWWHHLKDYVITYGQPIVELPPAIAMIRNNTWTKTVIGNFWTSKDITAQSRKAYILI